MLTEWGQAALADSVELIVSELMTNAIRACSDPVTGGPGYDAEGRQLPLGLQLASDRQQVLVEVWDGATAPPVPGQVSHDGETGRGLLMVEAVSSRWGYYYPARQPHGYRAGRAGRQGRLGPHRARGLSRGLGPHTKAGA